MTTGQIIEVGDLDCGYKEKVRGVIIEMTMEELKLFPVSDLYTDAAIIPCNDIHEATVTGFDLESKTITLQFMDVPDCAIGEIVHMFQSKTENGK